MPLLTIDTDSAQPLRDIGVRKASHKARRHPFPLSYLRNSQSESRVASATFRGTIRTEGQQLSQRLPAVGQSVAPMDVNQPMADSGGAHRWVWAAVGAVVLGLFGLALWAATQTAQPVPSFPLLSDAPDPSLHGTVAYFDNGTSCVRIVAASGAPSKQVYCLTKDDLAASEQKGKPSGPQLAWRSDGRLEVTLFRWVPSEDKESPPPMKVQWQKLLDVATGDVEDVAQDVLPEAPLAPKASTVNDRGEQILTDFDASTGRGTVTLSTSTATRTLLTIRGPGKYTYGLEPASWAPDGEWVIASDSGEGGRILVITPTEPAVTRVLVANSGGGAGGGTAGSAFAVTGDDLLR